MSVSPRNYFAAMMDKGDESWVKCEHAALLQKRPRESEMPCVSDEEPTYVKMTGKHNAEVLKKKEKQRTQYNPEVP